MISISTEKQFGCFDFGNRINNLIVSMQRDIYASLSDSKHEIFEFLSSGPKGSIKKVVQYAFYEDNIYNLGFGDWDEETQSIRDDVRSNNQDRDKVLATVAYTVFEFMKHHPGAVIYAQGSSDAKTRLYQMGVANNWLEIKQLFDVQGFFGGDWEPFRKGRNYQAFALKAK